MTNEKKELSKEITDKLFWHSTNALKDIETFISNEKFKDFDEVDKQCMYERFTSLFIEMFITVKRETRDTFINKINEGD